MSLTPLLSLLCSLSFFSLASCQDRPAPTAPDSCPVTKATTRPFVPPAPHFAKPSVSSVSSFWFGTERLWTALPENGTWRLGHYKPDDPTFRQKLFFWRQGFNPQTDLQPRLTVSGKRIDTEAPPLQTDGPGNNSSTGNDQFIVTGINFPTAGCWEVTGHYGKDELTFVVWVSP